MNPESHQRVKELFLAARDLLAGERAAYLERACEGDRDLLAEVESLLLHEDDPTSPVLRSPAPGAGAFAPGSPPAHAASLAGRRIGPYSLKRIIASGGMGTVYEAVQESPRRVVALKVMKAGIASRSALKRFEYESQILARLHHPGIAQVYEAGTHEDTAGGERVPFFAMEYIPGARPITRYAEDQKLGTRERLDLFARVCEAVHHGHQKGIIHRDLKPSNILVDSGGEPRVIDFGVARATDSDMAVTTLQTDVGQLIGTLQYMSPEQCAADPHDIDTRSDVYALGVLLYELLTGRAPYDLTSAAIHEAARIIREQPPTRPSTVIRALRGDIETVTLKALEKDRKRRYQSALDLQQDVKRYLGNEPIAARPPSLAYQVRMFARRNRTVFTAGVAVILALALGIVGISGGLVVAQRRANAERRAKEAAQASEAEARQAREAEVNARHDAERQKDAAEFEAYIANLQAADAALGAGDANTVRRRLDACPEHLRGWEWGYLDAKSDNSQVVLRSGGTFAAISPDGSRVLAIGAFEGSIWDSRTWKQISGLTGHTSRINDGSISPDGTLIVTAASDGTARVWDGLTGKSLHVLRHSHDVVNIAKFSPDGHLIATGSSDGTIRLWDTSNGTQTKLLTGHRGPVRGLDFSPDGTRLATNADDQRLWAIESGRLIAVLGAQPRPGYRLPILFSPDGRLILGCQHDTAKLWDSSTGIKLWELRVPGHFCTAAAFDPRGYEVALGTGEGEVHTWYLHASGPQHHTRMWHHSSGINAVSYSPDGLTLAIACQDSTIGLSNRRPNYIDTFSTYRGHEGSVHSVSFSSDGARLVSAGGRTVRIWDASPESSVGYLFPLYDSATAASLSSDGRAVVEGTHDGIVNIWNTTNCKALFGTKAFELPIFMASISSDGCRFIAASRPTSDTAGRKVNETDAKIWDIECGDTIACLGGHAEGVSAACLAPDGMLAATASGDTVRLWDVETGLPIRVIQIPQAWGGVHGLAFNPLSSRLVGASGGGVGIWNTSTGDCTFFDSVPGWTFPVFAMFSPDGQTILAGYSDGMIRLFAETGDRTVRELKGHNASVSCAAFTRDGTRVAAASDDGAIRLWDSASGKELLRIHGGGRASSLAFTNDDTSLVFVGPDSYTEVTTLDSVRSGDRYRSSKLNSQSGRR